MLGSHEVARRRTLRSRIGRVTQAPHAPQAPRARAAASYFASQAHRYRSAFPGTLSAVVREREELAVLTAAGDVTDLDVLELGCGDGHYARALVAAGARRVVAVDLVPEMVAQVTAPGIEGVVGDAARIDLGERFPLVVAAGMLEFSDEPAEVLANASRHAQAGARLVLLAPTADLAGALYRAWHRTHGVEVHLFTRQQLDGLARAAGWSPVHHARVAAFAQVAAYVREPA